MLNKKKFFLLITITILLMGIVSANEESNGSSLSSEKVLNCIEDSTDLSQNVIYADDNGNSEVEEIENQNYVTKNYNKTTKEATNNVYVNNYNELARQLESASNSKGNVYYINLKPGNYNATKDIDVLVYENSSKIIINGNNLTLDGNHLELRFYLHSNSLEFNDITIRNYDIDYFLYGEDSDVKLNNVKFINNKATNSLIRNVGNSLSISNSYFINSTGLSIASKGKLTINNTSFVNNTVYSNYTYAVVMSISPNGDVISINNSLFENNVLYGVYGDSSVMKVFNEDGTVKIHNSLFRNNGYGMNPCIYNAKLYSNNKNNFEISSCSFIDNIMCIGNHGNLNITNSNFSKTTGYAIVNSGNLKIANSTLNDNHGTDGGQYGPSVLINSGNVTIYDSDISNNSGKTGGAMSNIGNMTIVNSKLLNNVGQDGGAIYNTKGGYYFNGRPNLVINNTIIKNNTAKFIEYNSDAYYLDRGLGGGIYNDIPSSFTMIDSIIENNHATGSGDDVYFDMIKINKISPKQYGDEFNISGEFIESINNHTKNIPLTINFNGQLYNVKTDDNGLFSLSVKADTIGTNKVLIHYEGSEQDERGRQLNIVAIANITTIVTFNVNKIGTKIVIDPIQNSKINSNVSITGKFTDNRNNLLRYTPIKLQINGQEVSVKTDANGRFNTTVIANKEGTNNVTASYSGNARYAATTTKATFTVSTKEATKITVDPISEVQQNSVVVVTGKFVDVNGNSLRYTPITININGQAFKNSTNANGVYSYSFNATVLGVNNVSVSYPGNSRFQGATAKATFKVSNRVATKITVDSIGEARQNSFVTVSGKYVDVNGNSLRYTPITININGQAYRNNTNANGVYSYSFNATVLGVNNVSVSYPGNSRFQGATAKATFIVSLKKSTKITINTISSKQYNDEITVTGKFLDQDNNNLRWTPLKVQLNNNTYTTKTDGDGVYTLKVKVTTVGKNNITISYAGNARYAATTTKNTFNVNTRTTKITVNPVSNPKVNTKISITGKFTDKDGNALIQTPLIVTYGTVKTSVKTDNNGIFNYTFTPTAIGKYTLTFLYYGNARYSNATTNTTVNVKE